MNNKCLMETWQNTPCWSLSQSSWGYTVCHTLSNRAVSCVLCNVSTSTCIYWYLFILCAFLPFNLTEIFVLLCSSFPQWLSFPAVNKVNLIWVCQAKHNCSSVHIVLQTDKCFPCRPPSTAKSISIPGQEHTLQLDCKGEGTAEPGPAGGVSLGRSAKPRPSIISSGAVHMWKSLDFHLHSPHPLSLDSQIRIGQIL